MRRITGRITNATQLIGWTEVDSQAPPPLLPSCHLCADYCTRCHVGSPQIMTSAVVKGKVDVHGLQYGVPGRRERRLGMSR